MIREMFLCLEGTDYCLRKIEDSLEVELLCLRKNSLNTIHRLNIPNLVEKCHVAI